MVDGLQALDEYALGEGDVTEGNRTLLEEAVSHLAIDEFVDQARDALLGIFLE